MADQTVKIWLVIMLIFSVPAVLTVFASSLLESSIGIDPWLKVALILCTFGLMVQCVRSIHFFNHGHYPMDNIFPMWVTKDMGIVIFIFRYFLRGNK